MNNTMRLVLGLVTIMLSAIASINPTTNYQVYSPYPYKIQFALFCLMIYGLWMLLSVLTDMESKK